MRDECKTCPKQPRCDLILCHLMPVKPVDTSFLDAYFATREVQTPCP